MSARVAAVLYRWRRLLSALVVGVVLSCAQIVFDAYKTRQAVSSDAQRILEAVGHRRALQPPFAQECLAALLDLGQRALLPHELQRTAIAFLAAALSGTALWLAMGQWRLVDRSLGPLVNSILAM